MTCWPTEVGAVLNMIEHFGTGAFATVMDSYDYTAALNQVLPGKHSYNQSMSPTSSAMNACSTRVCCSAALCCPATPFCTR
jgi:hypothetical protein